MLHAMKAFQSVAARPIDEEEFWAIARDIQGGKRVSQQELADALCYADRLPELPELTKALVSAWNICMTRINFKNQQIARLDRKLKACKKLLEKEANHEGT